MKKYSISEEQFNTILHLKEMVDVHSETVRLLCNSEKDDIVYGFELGKMYNHLRDLYLTFTQLEHEIKKQDIKDA